MAVIVNEIMWLPKSPRARKSCSHKHPGCVWISLEIVLVQTKKVGLEYNSFRHREVTILTCFLEFFFAVEFLFLTIFQTRQTRQSLMLKNTSFCFVFNHVESI